MIIANGRSQHGNGKYTYKKKYGFKTFPSVII